MEIHARIHDAIEADLRRGFPAEVTAALSPKQAVEEPGIFLLPLRCLIAQIAGTPHLDAFAGPLDIVGIGNVVGDSFEVQLVNIREVILTPAFAGRWAGLTLAKPCRTNVPDPFS